MPEATEEQIIDALKKANAYNFLPAEYGINLHVGA